MSVWGDAQVFRNRIQTGWLGLGGVLLHDVAGSGNLTTTSIYGSVAYHQMVGYSSLITAGFNAGWVNKRINSANLKFPDQFDGQFFTNKMPSAVIIDQPNVNYFDMQVDPTPFSFDVFQYGIFNVWCRSLFHRSLRFDSKIPPRYIGFLNGSFKTGGWLF
jgi:hypothetical protein